MARITWATTLKEDIRILSEEVFEHALKNNEAPIEAEEAFKEALKQELIKVGSLIQNNPFACQEYNKSNPTRRGVISNGNFILEYQLKPMNAQESSQVSEVIFTAVVPAKSKRYKGAYGDIELVNFDDLLSDN